MSENEKTENMVYTQIDQHQLQGFTAEGWEFVEVLKVENAYSGSFLVRRSRECPMSRLAEARDDALRERGEADQRVAESESATRVARGRMEETVEKATKRVELLSDDNKLLKEDNAELADDKTRLERKVRAGASVVDKLRAYMGDKDFNEALGGE